MSHRALGVQFQLNTTQHQHRIDAVHPEAGVIGHIAIEKDNGEVANVEVEPTHQRSGVATALWRHAQHLAERGVVSAPQHSRVRTHVGDMWAHSVGGELPDPPDEDDDRWAHS